MPGRIIPLATNETYHIINRGIASQPTFIDSKNYQRAVECLRYYQNKKPPIKYSRYLQLAKGRRAALLDILAKEKQFLVEIIAYCFMPNHFHLLLKQLADNGISKFVSNFTNSYTRYFNTKNERNGPIFQGRFKAKRIETEEQLLHVSRYIHLNPFSSYVVKSLKDLEKYPYSSLLEYLDDGGANFCSKEMIADNFKNEGAYKKFVFDQADYQRELDKIKHLTLEK